MEEPRKQPPPPNIPTEPASSEEPAAPPASPRGESQDGAALPASNQDKPAPAMPPQPPQPRPAERQQGIRPQPQPYRPEQKRTRLERGEVRTMEKDIIRVREEGARQEQQRIAELKSHREAEREREAVEKIRATALATKQQEETQRREELKTIRESILPPGEERRIRDLPSPPSSRKKLVVRLLIVIFFAFIALNVVLFASWFFFFRDRATPLQLPQIPFISQFFQPEPSEPSPPPPSPLPPPPAPTPPPLVSPLQAAINPVHTSTLQFSDGSNLPLLLAQFLQIEQRPEFTQILFSQQDNQELLSSASAFFDLVGVQLPSSIVPHFSLDSFFFLYSYERGNRFGMIVETPSPEEAREALAQWESAAEQDLAGAMPFWWGREGPPYTTSWRSSAHQGVEIRFQTFSLQDYGVVYALVDKYVIFASSFEATVAAIEALQLAAQDSEETEASQTLLPLHTFKPPPSLSSAQSLGQVLMIGFQGATVTPELQDTIKRLQPGGVLLLSNNIQSIEQLRQLTQDLQSIALQYSSLPLFIAVDQEGGAISRIEFGREKTAQATIQSTKQAYEVGQLRAEELKFLGVNLNLSPVLDRTEPRDFLFERTFQAGRLEAGQLAKALLQGQKENGILSTVKHFPGYGNIAFNPEYQLAAVHDLPDISPFVFALPAKPEFLLLSNVIYAGLDPDRPFSFSPEGISLVRADLNFEGIILTDDLSQPSLLNNYALETIVKAPLKAGVNMLMFSQEPYARKAHETLRQLMQEDPFLKKRVEDSAARILRLKKEFFSSPEPPTALEHSSQK